ncbi:MAG: hypothetical protein HY762_06390 [Planctomycetes bacterium]|nr:hypothetical protein [Planctomycetota bacterium]
MNILKIKWLKDFIRRPYFNTIVQLPFVILFLLIIFSGLFGSGYRNVSGWLVGAAWLMFITALVLTGGKTWCLVCPWNALSDLIVPKRWRLGMKYPKAVRDFSLAILFFALLIWLEYTFGVTDNPRLIAYLCLIILGLTVISVLFFDAKSFCRYGCPVGAICGLYSIIAPLELRSADKNTCQQCRTKDCIRGNDTGQACPVFEYPGLMDNNTYCILCTECIRTCPNDNIALNLRYPHKELTGPLNFKSDESILIMLMAALSIFGAAALSPVYQQMIDRTGLWTGATGHHILIITIVLGAVTIAAFGIYILCRVFNVLPYLLLPVALCCHLANTLKLFNLRATEIVSLVSDPFGWRWNLFGTAGYLPGPLVEPAKLWYFLTFLIIAGVVFGIYSAWQCRRKMTGFIVAVLLMIIIAAINWRLL